MNCFPKGLVAAVVCRGRVIVLGRRRLVVVMYLALTNDFLAP